MRQIAVRVDDDLHAAIEAARGEIPRERWMRAALASAAGEPDRVPATRAPRDRSTYVGGGLSVHPLGDGPPPVVRRDVGPKPFTPPRPKGKI